MARYFRREILQMILWGLVRPWFTLLPPFFINRILTWALDREKGKHVSILVATSYAIGLFASIVTKTLCSSEALVIGRRLGTRINAIVAAEVYEKLLKRRTYASSSSSSASASEHPASAGKAQNIISNDAGQGMSVSRRRLLSVLTDLLSTVAKLFAFNPFFFPDAILSEHLAI